MNQKITCDIGWVQCKMGHVGHGYWPVTHVTRPNLLTHLSHYWIRIIRHCMSLLPTTHWPTVSARVTPPSFLLNHFALCRPAGIVERHVLCAQSLMHLAEYAALSRSNRLQSSINFGSKN